MIVCGVKKGFLIDSSFQRPTHHTYLPLCKKVFF